MTDSLLSLFLESESFVVATHISPDGDAIGSQVGLGLFLERLGKSVTMINDESPPHNMDWLTDPHGVQVFEGSLEQREQIDEADVAVVVDTNCAERLGSLATPIRQSRATKVLIDHHPDPEGWFDYSWTREGEAATGQMIFELIEAYGLDIIDRPIAEALYAAIMTDTGSFRYSSVTADVHRSIAELVDRGDLAVETIHSLVFDRRTLNGIRLLGRAVESIRLAYSGRLGYMVVTRDMAEETGASLSETDGFIDYVLAIEGVEVAVIFKEGGQGTKMSFRSKGTWPVNGWARHFDGGGHRNASGAYVENLSFEEVIDAVIKAAPRFVPDLETDTRPNGLQADDSTLLSAFRGE
jgi:phosphoesterase RecJ-like protein